jgi:hypothetical protein
MLRIAMGASAERLQVNKIPANSQSGAQDRPPLRPRWLHPVSSASVVGIFVAFFASGIYWREPQVVDLNAISADLIPEGEAFSWKPAIRRLKATRSRSRSPSKRRLLPSRGWMS